MSETPTITILVIDDDSGIRESIKAGLELPDFTTRILTAHNAVTGLQIAKAEYPDVVILDMQMPMGNGLDVADNLKNDSSLRNTKIIMLTALDNRDMLWQAIEHGIDDFMSKPFDLIELEGRVFNLINRTNRRSVI